MADHQSVDEGVKTAAGTPRNQTTKKEVNRGAWTDEEDRKLAEAIEIFGPKRWKTIAAKAGLAPSYRLVN